MLAERVLVVDDDPAILMLCHRILEADGYHVVDAKRGEDALIRLEQEPIDLLLTDIRLPGLNGLEVTRHLRERHLETTVITMTGYSNMDMAIQALSLGVDEFIVKPFTPDTLRIHVSRALEKSRLRRENTRLQTLVPLLQSATTFSAARTPVQVWDVLVRTIQTLLGTENVAVFECPGDGTAFVPAQVRGGLFEPLQNAFVSETQLPWQAGEQNRVRVWDQSLAAEFPVSLPGVSWMVLAPLVTNDVRYGLVVAAVPVEPSASDLEALQLAVVQAANALETVDLLAKMSHAYAKTRDVEQVKSEFINLAGNELRTPLAVVLGYANILQEHLEGELQEYAAQVLIHARKLYQISDDMLSLKYLEAGRVDLHLERCQVDQVVSQAVHTYRPLARQRDQSLEFQIDNRAGELNADRAMLELMLGNLLSNAIKFSPPHSRVRVAAKGDDSHVTLIVQDQGVGLTPGDAEHIFEPFFQAGDPRRHREGGIGLGLTLTREMVQAHGGKIWVESTPMQGSAFYISLPRAHEGAATNGH